MAARARSLQARLLPHGWLDALRQVTLFALAYFAYRLVRGFAEGDANAAFAHARDLISLERGMHLFVEPSVQAWASGSHFVILLASWLYVNAQGPITIAALLYVYMRHNSSFYFVRNMFLIAMAIALVAYIVFPTAPPRFLPEWGFTDTRRVLHARARRQQQRLDDRPLQPVRRGALDARGVRADDRLAARAPVQAQRRAGAVARVPVPDDVRDRRHRQPLHRGRAARRAHRRRVLLRGRVARARAARRVAVLRRLRVPARLTASG